MFFIACNLKLEYKFWIITPVTWSPSSFMMQYFSIRRKSATSYLCLPISYRSVCEVREFDK